MIQRLPKGWTATRIAASSTSVPMAKLHEEMQVADFSEGMSLRRSQPKNKERQPLILFYKLESRRMRRAGGSSVEKEPELFLYGDESPEPTKATPAEGPALPFLFKEIRLNYVATAEEIWFSRIATDPKGQNIQHIYVKDLV